MTDGFGRGRRGELARELQAAVGQRGVDLLPGKARDVVDDRIKSVALMMGLTEPSAMRYLPPGWAEETATAMVLGLEAPKLEEQMTDGVAEVPLDLLGRLIEGLAVVVVEASWRDGGEQISMGVGEPLDRLSSLARALASADGSISVRRQDLLGAARHLSQLADYLHDGHRHSADGEEDGQSLARTLQEDAAKARQSASP